ncbi:MAG: energy-coupling factor ABC transporter permease [Neisseriaceae bacterium]|nr:energy-coupling factor ABC transporter permease [Neisseriaceae bacterium]MBP6862799.1 energy-coupling factor ABC transporter permease [Neisseriaceae bacterium]
MNFLKVNFSEPILLMGWAVMMVALLAAGWRLRQGEQKLLPLGIGLLWLCLLWSLHAGVKAGVTYHLLGGTLLTLTLGPAVALWLMAIAGVLYTGLFLSLDDFWALGLSFSCTALPSVLVSYGLLRAAQKWLPKHLFIFILGNGFFAGAASMVVVGLIVVGLLDTQPDYSERYLWGEAFPVYFLIAWAEAFLTGLLSAILVTFAPQHVQTFDDAEYLKRRSETGFFDSK